MQQKKKILLNKFSFQIFLVFFSLYFFLTFILLKDLSPFLKYPLLARQFLNDSLDLNRIPDLSPLYFYFNMAIMYFTDSIPLTVKIVRLIQIIIVSASAVLLFNILKNYFSKSVSIFGIIIFALNGSLIIYSKIMEPEIFMIFFLITFLYFIHKKKENKYKNIFIAGLSFSLGVLTRSNFLPIVIIIPFYFWFENSDKKKTLKNIMIFIIPVITSILFLIIRNYTIRGEFSPYAADPGYVFFEGNNPLSTGQSAIYPPLVNEIALEYPNKPDFHHQVYAIFARKIKNKNLSVVKTNAFWSKKARNYIFDYPLNFINLILKKTHYFFHDYRRHDLNNAYNYDQNLHKTKFPLFPFWIISVLSIFGIIISVKKWKKNIIFLSLFFMQFIVLMLVYVSERQRLAILPIFIFFSLYVIDYLIKNKKRVFYLSIILIISYFALSVKNDLMLEEDYIWQSTILSHKNWIRAKEERTKYRINKAINFIHKSISETPWLLAERRLAYIPFKIENITDFINKKSLSKKNFSELFSKAIFLIEIGKLKNAEQILIKLYENNYRFKRDFFLSSQPLFYLGIIEEKKKNYFKAVNYFKECLKENPGSVFTLSHLFALTELQVYKKKIVRYYDIIDAEFFIGKANLGIEKYLKAKKNFEKVLNYFPNYRKALIYYAVTLGRLKLYDKAVVIYLKAIKNRIEPVYFEKDIINIFKKWDNESNNTIRKYYLGLILGQYGYYKESIYYLNKALFYNNKIKFKTIIDETIKKINILKKHIL